MAYNRRQPLRSATSESSLSSRITSFADITDIENYESYENEIKSPLRGRESLVSLQSYDERAATRESADVGHSYPQPSTSSWTGSLTYNEASGGYEPVSGSGGVPWKVARMPSGRLTQRLSSQRETPEEYDLALLSAAAPMGKSSRYEAIPENEPEPEPEPEPAFDLTATLGPATSHDEAFMKKLQEQEARGQLTGGLGAGPRVEKTVTSSALLAAPQPMERSLSRSFTRRRPDTTIRGLGQEEANRRGEVIQVVLDEPSDVDLSAMVGPDGLDDAQTRRSTMIMSQKTQIFYPQSNWKPFSMRWPYLSVLVFLSVTLAVIEEILFQRSLKQPLLQFSRPSDVPGIQYFIFKFLPTIIAVTYGVLWQITDFDVKRLEAYYQLSKESGALAGESINVGYLQFISFIVPFRAIGLKHYAVAISSCASFLALSLVPTFSSASIILTPDRDTRLANPDGEKFIVIQAVWSRLLTTTLCVCAVLACMLLYMLESRKSGLLADVRGIAGLASLANKSHILVDFQDMDTARHTEIHQKLNHRRYMLRNSSLAPDEGSSVSLKDRDRFQKHHLSENPHPLMLRARGSIPFIIGILLLTGFIPVFLFTPGEIITDKAPWIVTALAVCIKLGWGSFETDVRMMEPFFVLSLRHAPPQTLTLDYTALPFGYLPVRAFLNGHFIVGFVGIGTVISDVLTILLTSLATVEGRDFIGLRINPSSDPDNDPQRQELIDSGEETPLSFWISLILALFILCFMAVTATVVFIRRRHPFLPRQPNTIASILAYIHQSKMLYDFVDTEKLSHDGMIKKLEEINKKYGLGWFEGRDGRTHCGVDEEELISNYKHGVDFEQANKPWDSQWQYL